MKTGKLGAESVLQERGGVASLRFPRLADPQILNHAVSTRVGGIGTGLQGTLNISFKTGEERVCVKENRSLLAAALGMDIPGAVCLDQVHGDQVLKLDASNRRPGGGSLGAGDGLITKEVGVPIALLVADCLPVLFYDPIHKAAGMAHAGWRGTVSHTAAKTLLAMGEAYGTKAEEVRAVLGPCIGSCCYEVGADVHKEFSSVFPWAGEVLQEGGLGRWKLDLAEANARQLLEIGVQNENLIRSGLCTVGHIDLFYSHRAEASPERSTGRMGAFMMLNG